MFIITEQQPFLSLWKKYNAILKKAQWLLRKFPLHSREKTDMMKQEAIMQPMAPRALRAVQQKGM
jgi:hypothetical protein